MTEANGGRMRMRYSYESRRRAVELVLLQGMSVAAAAASQGMGRSTLYRWLARRRAEGWEGLRDRSSRPQRSPRRTAEAVEAAILEARERTRAGPVLIGAELGLPASTVGAVLRRHGCSRLPRPPREPARRYEREQPGDLLHVDIKQYARFRQPGWRVYGDGRTRSPGAGYEYAHAAVDDRSRLSYVELPPSRNRWDAAAFLGRAAAWFARLGIGLREVLTDNGGCYRTAHWSEQCAALGLSHLCTRPYRPQTNGKAERFIQTLTRSWAQGWSYPHSVARAEALPSWLHWYNHHRPHAALGALPPSSRVPHLPGCDT